jgi:hypothetical protein
MVAGITTITAPKAMLRRKLANEGVIFFILTVFVYLVIIYVVL